MTCMAASRNFDFESGCERAMARGYQTVGMVSMRVFTCATFTLLEMVGSKVAGKALDVLEIGSGLDALVQGWMTLATTRPLVVLPSTSSSCACTGHRLQPQIRS